MDSIERERLSKLLFRQHLSKYSAQTRNGSITIYFLLTFLTLKDFSLDLNSYGIVLQWLRLPDMCIHLCISFITKSTI